MINSKLVNSVLCLFIALCVPLLFFGSQTLIQFRLLPYLWDYGHIALFAAIFWLVFSKWNFFAEKSIYSTLLTTVLPIVIVSVPIELIQDINGREFSFLDIIRNCLGAAIATAFHPDSFSDKRTFSRSKLKYSVVGVLIIFSYPLLINTVDTINAYRSFPVLSDFESPFELTRWSGNQLEVEKLDTNKNHILGNTFTTDEYSNLTFESFPGDWAGFSSISFKVFNDDANDRILNLRIHDQGHRASNWGYHDRFNQVIKLASGWNKITVDLNLVRVQPLNREIDMSKIEEIIIFSHNFQTNVRLYFDDFKLDKSEQQ